MTKLILSDWEFFIEFNDDLIFPTSSYLDGLILAFNKTECVDVRKFVSSYIKDNPIIWEDDIKHIYGRFSRINKHKYITKKDISESLKVQSIISSLYEMSDGEKLEWNYNLKRTIYLSDVVDLDIVLLYNKLDLAFYLYLLKHSQNSLKA